MKTQTQNSAALLAPETCPVCASVDVRVRDDAWFAIELDRADDLRQPVIAFTCRECGWHWD